MKILAISKEPQPVEWELYEELLRKEAQTLHQLYLAGSVREFYFTSGGDAVLILESVSEEEALKILQKLPLADRGLITFDVTELAPYTGFSRLMPKGRE
ncbi:MAG: hypothetical protein PHP04_10980 [Bacteroidales bacterium]|nr:hypothetical protein [Bacteroidales bacterium]HNW74643.1 hypothetical protein [Bacteroidales bacterium]HPS51813.1 hypothetical protein [Bacteroidales bacterium]